MANSFLIQAAAGFVVLVFVAGSITFFTTIVLRLLKGGGEVRTTEFRLPEGLMALVLGSFFVGMMGKALSHGGGGRTPSITIEQVMPSSIVFLLFAAGIAAYLKYYRGMRLRQVFGINRLPAWKTAAWASGSLVCAYPLTGIAAMFTQMVLKKEELVQQSLVQLFRELANHNHYADMAKIVVAGVVLAPLCEEFLFRGFFYGVGKRFVGPLGAGFLSALLFASFHMNLAGFGSLFILATCFTLAYERTGSLLVPMGMHALYNFISLAFIFSQAKGWFPSTQ